MEAWITSVLKKESATNAIVLANSLRRSGTTRKIAIIVSLDVFNETWIALNKAFDCVFTMQQHITENGEECLDARIFAFSLCCFEKCVYISPDHLVIENADNLFEGKEALKLVKCRETDSIDWSIFMLTPNKNLWQFLLESCGTEKEDLIGPLQTWLGNEQSWPKETGHVCDQMLATFSMLNQTLLSDETHAPIIRFTNAGTDCKLLDQMKSLLSSDAGFREKSIAAIWLDMFSQSPETYFSKQERSTNESIAIVGMSCRYPGASSLAEFWDMLKNGGEAAGEPPSFRWTKEHTNIVSEEERKTIAGFLKERVDEFDTKFFGVSPKDMTYMDPQVRLLHEIFWEALEDSGIDPLTLHGTHTGVFTGSWLPDYWGMLQESADPDFYRTYMGVGIGAAAARLSFLLGLTGPSIATESGCSSAMVALGLAVKSLRTGETNLAVVGGVNLLLKPFTSKIMEFVVSPDGRSKTFDADADGFGRAEGCGVLVLKRLSDAIRENDKIWATIRGCAVAQEGPSRSFGTPTVHCEALAMKLALEDANVRPEQVSFVEAHGTGTSVGDPIEVNAIAKAYHTPCREQPLVLGSVKTNVGHTESCSGITGIMKVILAMQNQLIPKHLNFNSLNPEIFLDSIPAMLPLEATPWTKVQGQPRIAGVSSFGITGTDGHVIIQEAPDHHQPKFVLGMERTSHILKISGKTGEAFSELVVRYETLFSENKSDHSSEAFGNAAFTANVGRATFGHRAFLVAGNYHEAAQILNEKRYFEGKVNSGESRQICFLFSGQGSQYPGMAKTLYETSPIFRIHFDKCDRILKQEYNLSICPILFSSTDSSNQLNRTIYSQTSIFCVEYCLLKLWQSWGIHPDYVLGHSLGEFCAAVAAQILSFEDALKLVVERSKPIDSLPGGSMLVVRKGQRQVIELLQRAELDLDIAAVNTLEQTVVSGDTEKVHAFSEFLKARHIKSVLLAATHAFHSRHMDSMLEKYKEVASSISPQQGNNVQYVSALEGTIISDSCFLDANYWIRHTRECVSFKGACSALVGIERLDFLEIGSQPILSSFVMENSADGSSINCMPSLRKGADDWRTILNSLGKLSLLGYNVDWKNFDKPYLRKKVSLPFHPFHKKSFWMDCNGNNEVVVHPLLGHSINNPSSTTIFKNNFSLQSAPFISDHRVGERIVFPGAGYVEMCLSAGHYVANGMVDRLDRMVRGAICLENFHIDAPLEITEGRSSHLQVLVDLSDIHENEDEKGGEGYRVRIYHQNSCESASDKWVLHASSNFAPVAGALDMLKMWKPKQISNVMSTEKPSESTAFYKAANEQGLKYGDAFKMIRRFWTRKQAALEEDVDEVVVEIGLTSDYSKYILHPLIIDAVFQSVFLATHRYGDNKLKVPIAIGRITILQEIAEIGKPDETLLYIHTWKENGRYFADISTGWDAHSPVVLFEDIQLIETNVRTIESILEQQSSDIADAWQETWKPIHGLHSSVVQVVELEHVLSDDRIQSRLNALRDAQLKQREEHDDLDLLLYSYILNAFFELGWRPVLGEKMSVQQFCERFKIQAEFHKLIRFYFTIFTDEGILQNDNKGSGLWQVKTLPLTPSDLQRAIKTVGDRLIGTSTSVLIPIYENLAKNLAFILTGQVSALSLLFPTDEANVHLSADSLYQRHPSRTDREQIMEQVGNFIMAESVSKNAPHPGRIFRVLEVGSGTGAMTSRLITALRNQWSDAFELYFTDLSQYFFIKAEEKFGEFKQNIKYAVFNIEDSPLSQGIPLGYFDMVCAVDVLHATRSLEDSLIHLRQTLRPGGVLLINETVVHSRSLTFVFGFLEGYWRFQDFHCRPDHCCVGEHVWKRLLAQTGYTCAHSYPVFLDQFAVIAAVANPQVDIRELLPSNAISCAAPLKGEWVIFTEGSSSSSRAIASQLTDTLVVSGFKVVIALLTSDEEMSLVDFNNGLLKDSVTVTSIQAANEEPSEINSIFAINGEKKNIQGIILICGLDSRDRANVKGITVTALNIVKTLVAQSTPPPLFILTQGVQTVTEDSLSCNPNPAIVHGMAKCLKNENSSLFVRCLDYEQGSEPVLVAAQLLYEVATKRHFKEQTLVHVAYRDGLRYEPKFIKVPTQNSTEQLKLPTGSNRYHLVLPESRSIQDLRFDILEGDPVEQGEIEVKVKAYALNFRDVFAVLKPSKQFEQINSIGLDFAGVVTKVAQPSNLAVGDCVFGANYFKETTLASHLVLHSASVLRIPENMTFWEAATLPAVFSTAYHCLVTVAKMKMGDTVLIHTASGGVGLAAIQLAKQVGAKLVCTAGNSRKRKFVRGLDVEHVFHSRNTSYEQDILRVTNGRGVDIVLNSITGPEFKEATLRCCAPNARFIEMSKLNVWTCEEVRALRSDVNYEIVDLTVLGQDQLSELLDKMQMLLSEGSLKPIPYSKFDALHIRQAFHFFQKAKHIGKVVCTMPEVVRKQGSFKVNVPLFSNKSSYMITGGLGGIGFEVCKWMLELGATDVVLVGRSPPSPAIATEIERLNASGFNVTVILGDIGDYDSCKRTIEKIGREGKPLRGVMHCAGVLRDNMFPNQTWQSFEATFNPKVNGTWNLHELTSSLPLEHFVMFSSITALLGTPSQSSHAAANCFEDAFIHYRHSLGLAGTTVNWGQWSQVGCAVDANLPGVLPVSVKRMLNGLEMTLKTLTRQLSFCEFDSFDKLSALCSTFKNYLDKRHWKEDGFNNNRSVGGNRYAINTECFWEEMDRSGNREEKMAVMSIHLKSIVRAALRLEPEEHLEDNANLQELGVDSLLMIELKNSIQNLVGSRLIASASLLSGCESLGQIASVLVDASEQTSDDSKLSSANSLENDELYALLSTDVYLPNSIPATIDLVPACRPSQVRNVLVTGATGHLGTHIIAQLLTLHGSVDRVVCLLEKGDSQTAFSFLTERLKVLVANLDLTPQKGRIECLAGDVTMDDLGVTQEDYAKLCRDVDAVIHCAQKSNFLEPYKKTGNMADIRNFNVGGTLNILKLASTHKSKHVYYPSSLALAFLGTDGGYSDEWPTSENIKTAVDFKSPGVYMCKGVCESLLFQANGSGVPCKVFRFPEITGHSETGQLDSSKSIYMARFSSYLRMGVMPALPTAADFVPVDLCAEFSLKLFLSDDAPFEIFNIGHPAPQTEQEFVQLAQQEFGIQLQLLQGSKFLLQLQKLQQSQEDAFQRDMIKNVEIVSMVRADAWSVFTQWQDKLSNFFKNEKVQKFIPNYEQRIPPSMEIVKRDLAYLRSTGQLDNLGVATVHKS